jgi:methionine sulfoxide reductase heme-binding subunit
MDRPRNPSIQDWLVWVILALPAGLMIVASRGADIDVQDLLRESGEFSARLMIAAMMIGPLSELIGRRPWVRALIRHRRHFGVAAFLYAVLHLFYYFTDMEWSLTDMLAEIDAPGIWTGWIAILVMLAPALASNDAAMRLLRRNWKRVQQLVYLVGLATIAHWVILSYGPGPALVHFLPLIGLNLARLGKRMTRRTAS